MDQSEAIIIARKYAEAIEKKFSYKQIFLFGSYARGNQNPDSDIDIAVIFNDYNDFMDMQLELMRIRRKIDTRIEPHPFRENEFNLSNPMVNEILKFGMQIKNL